MKQPISPSDIREGDLIRFEYADTHGGYMRAMEYVADQSGPNWYVAGQHYLLDRPTPPVELPIAPTLGYLHWRSGTSGDMRVLASWGTAQKKPSWMGDKYVSSDLGHHVQRVSVTGFTPVVAVPTDALADLRGRFRVSAIPGTYATPMQKAVGRFLDAVDAANAEADA